MGASSPTYRYNNSSRRHDRDWDRARDRDRDRDRESYSSRDRDRESRHSSRRSSSAGPRYQQPISRRSVPSRNFSKGPFPPSSLANEAILQPPPPLYDPSAYSRRGSIDSYRSRPTTPGSYDLDSPVSSSHSTDSRPVSRSFTPQTLTDDTSLRSTDSLAPPPVTALPVPRPASTLSKSPASAADKQAKRKSFFGNIVEPKKDRSGRDAAGPPAWIIGHSPKVPFDVQALVAGQPMHDIWDPNGNVLVYLFKDKGPSFRVQAEVLASSRKMARMVFGDDYVDAMDAHNGATKTPVQRPDLTPPMSYTWQQASRDSTPDSHGRNLSSQFGSPAAGSESGLFPLYLDVLLDKSKSPLTSVKDGKTTKQILRDDGERLIVHRNLFAFLTGQSLVATQSRPSSFAVFMCLSNLLKGYEFSNKDDTNFGKVAADSFDEYVKELKLADVRNSREKTIESLILGERMRSKLLYNEAYTHAVAKLEDLQALKHPKWKLISPETVNRMGRAAIELGTRIANIRIILTNFDFPDVIALLDNSKSSDERKIVNFDAWHRSFDSFRKFYMSYYKKVYGSWPPKANSKKNNLETDGLSRSVLQLLYKDLCAMYDLLVDRHDLTNRTADGVVPDGMKDLRPTARAMRRILGDYDKSSPPVKPPVPFDLPRNPSMRSVRPGFGDPANKKHDAKLLSKKLKSEDLAEILRGSHNTTDVEARDFVDAFKKYEFKSAHGCDLTDVIDLRMGQWLFMYAVLQALPLLVMDAPEVRFSDKVEYFLCSVPRSGVPWATSQEKRTEMNWYGIRGGGGVVSLPTDVIENSVDGIYRRSHCWEVADRWTRDDPSLNTAVHEQQSTFSPFVAEGTSAFAAAPDTIAAAIGPEIRSTTGSIRVGGRRTRSLSPGARKARQSIINFGLQALPVPVDAAHDDISAITPRGAVGADRHLRRQTVAPPSAASTYEVDATKTFENILTPSQLGNRRK